MIYRRRTHWRGFMCAWKVRRRYWSKCHRNPLGGGELEHSASPIQTKSGESTLPSMSARPIGRPTRQGNKSLGFMDAHTLELLEFHKVRELVAGYAACSLGKDLALLVEPSTSLEAIR